MSNKSRSPIIGDAVNDATQQIANGKIIYITETDVVVLFIDGPVSIRETYDKEELSSMWRDEFGGTYVIVH
jgi:hypothetical protein